MNWYKKSKQDVLVQFATDEQRGLSEQDVLIKRAQYGRNITTLVKPFSTLATFFAAFTEPLIVLLAGASVVIFFAGDPFDAFIILGIILLNATIGVVQERRIALMINRLRTFKKQQTVVLREGKKQVVDDQELVPGDIILLQEGEHIPADVRILESYGVTVDQAALTGESKPVTKSGDAIFDDRELAGQSNMLFCGSHVVTGYARGLVVTTGEKTEGRKLPADVELFSHQMPLQRDLTRVLSFILWLIVFICLSLFIIGLLAGKPFGELLAALIALFMCVVPQGLPVIMTIILVTGAYSMARHKLVAKRLQALEALGRSHVALFDKTGTLTKNELMVVALEAGGVEYTVTGIGYHNEGGIYRGKTAVSIKQYKDDRILLQMMRAALLLDRSVLEWHDHTKKWSVKGSPNEAALRVCAVKYGLTPAHVELEYTKLYEIPFGSNHQYHVGFYEKDGKGVIFGIGSFEALSKRCAYISQQERAYAERLLQQGLRVLAFATKEFSLTDLAAGKYQEQFFVGLFDEGLTFLGTVGISDTLRENAAEVVHRMQKAGIQVVMATGDSVTTASYIACQAGIAKDQHTIIEGVALRRLSDHELASHLATTTVYARLIPSDKLRLVAAFQKQGKLVMVVGDGVNDVPALSMADVSVAMNATGSEVAKEAAHILLLDDAFEQLPRGIEYGRHIFYTFKRVILYFFTTNFAEVLVMLFCLAGGYPVPLLACQILWLNLVTDGFLDTALALEPIEDHLMNKGWLEHQTKLMTTGLALQVLYSGVMAAGVSCAVFVYYLKKDLALARTMAMVTLTCCQWVTALNCRSLDRSIFSLHPFSNRWLAGGLLGILITQITLVTVPFFQLLFKTVPLSCKEWALVGASGLLLLVVEEIRKQIKRASTKAY